MQRLYKLSTIAKKSTLDSVAEIAPLCFVGPFDLISI